MTFRAVCAFVLTLAAVGIASIPAYAQDGSAREAEVIAVAEAALQALSDEDMVAFTDLMVNEAVLFSVVEREEGVRYSARTRESERAQVPGIDIEERGFDPEVRISGALAVIWLPYDIYLDGEWSHCGVDTLTLLHLDGSWKIASLAYSIEQPPACRPHPDGPPGS